MSKKTILNELENGYSVQSGVFGAINSKVVTKLNKYGQYEAAIDGSKFSVKELDDFAAVSAMSNYKLNETVLGKKLFSDIKGVKHDEILGYYTDLYAGHVVEGDYRANASSGGVGTWLLTRLFEKKLIDGVIHVHPGAGGDEVLFEYTISRSIKDIKAGAKSRYYPVDLSEVLRTVKKKKGRYAITGIPSFITELRLLAERDSEFKKSIAYTIGLICGHQKSTKYAEALAWQHGIKPGDLLSIDFRKKVEGQPASRYISEFTGLIEGKKVTITKDQDELFPSNWGHGFFKSKFSDFTDDTFNETSDISLGDAWLPEYTKDSKGTNVIIVRNSDIADIVKDGVTSGSLQLDTLSSDRIIKSQSGLVHHTQDELPYRLSRQERRDLWVPKKRFEASDRLPYLRKRVQDLREKMATLSHSEYQAAVNSDDWSHFESKMKPYVYQYNFLYKIINAQKLGVKGVVRKIVKKINL